MDRIVYNAYEIPTSETNLKKIYDSKRLKTHGYYRKVKIKSLNEYEVSVNDLVIGRDLLLYLVVGVALKEGIFLMALKRENI